MPAYRLVCHGSLEPGAESAFEGMTVARDAEEIVLSGEVVDAAHLHGLIHRLDELGLELVLVEPATDSPDSPG